jgi:hypothetical protein
MVVNAGEVLKQVCLRLFRTGIIRVSIVRHVRCLVTHNAEPLHTRAGYCRMMDWERSEQTDIMYVTIPTWSLWGGNQPAATTPPTWRATDCSPSDRYPLKLPACVALPVAYIPTGIALRVTWVRRLPHHVHVLVHEEDKPRTTHDYKYNS